MYKQLSYSRLPGKIFHSTDIPCTSSFYQKGEVPNICYTISEHMCLELFEVHMANQITALVEGETLTYQQNEESCQIQLGTRAWYIWLQSATLFRVRGPFGTFTVRRERAGNQRGNWYWRAYYKHHGTLQRVYLGTAEEVTLERIRSAATHFFAPTPPGIEETRPPLIILPKQHASRITANAMQQATKEARTPIHTQPPPLPQPLTSLIGREQEIAAAYTQLAQPDVRILTLTGTGGVGKTRLALAIAAEFQKESLDGIYFVSLAPIRATEQVLPTIVQALGLPERNRAALNILQTELREQHSLLILDNFEQVVTAAPGLLDLLAACPHLKLLITSREILRVRGEHEFVVQPLALPNAQSNKQTLTSYSAVALFLERAREVQPTPELTDLMLIAEICRRLDGLPLALELAAARLKILSLQTLLERLKHRLHILTGGPRDLPIRQQTLRQTIAWSYDLLTQEEQRLFRLLAIFVNGCTLEAAEAVYNTQGGERAQVLDNVTSLLDKHLLYQSDPGDPSPSPNPRLLLHETMREYGLEALSTAQELEAARQAHAEYYLGLTEAHLEGSQMVVWLAQLRHEYANLHAALQWALEQPTNEIALRLENALLHFWGGHQRLSKGSSTLGHALAGKQDITHITTEAPAPDQGKQNTISDPQAAMLQHKLAGARHLARSLCLLGMIAWVIGDNTMAHLYTIEGLARARDADDKITLAYLLDLSGQVALDQGEESRACTLLEEGLTLHQKNGDTLGSLNALYYLGRAYAIQGDITKARAYTREHLALSKEIGYQPGIISALFMQGRLALTKGNTATASQLFTESLALLRETNENSPLAIATNLQGLGVTLAEQGRQTEAVRLWGAAEALCPLLPEERAFVARATATVHTTLSDKEFNAAWAEGQAMTQEQALAAIGQIAQLNQTQSTKNAGKNRRHYSHNLTTREEEVLRLVAQGLTDAQIAETLVISPRTVNAHLRSIYTKLNISSRNAATHFALEHHMI